MLPDRFWFRSRWVLMGLAVVVTVGCGRSSDEAATSSSNTASSERVDSANNQPSANLSPPTPSLASVRSAVQSGRTQQGLKLAQAFLLAKPNHPEALSLAAACLLAVGRNEEGIETLRLVPEDDPQFGLAALGQIADWQMRTGKLKEAEKSFRRILQIHGEFPLAHSRLALLMNVQGKRFEAMPHLLALAKMEDITRRELGGLIIISDQCRVENLEGSTGSEGDLVEGDLRRARQLGMNGKWDESMELAEQLHQAFPESASIAAFLGITYINLQETASLEAWLQSIPEGIEQQPEYWSVLARWMALRGEHEQAIRCATESLARDPTNDLLYESLARSLIAVGEDELAAEAMSRAEKLTEVLEAYQRTLEPDPTADDYAAVASGLLDLRRPWETLGWLKAAANLDPRSKLMQQVGKRLQDFSPAPDDARWVICGIDAGRYGLPSLAMASSLARLPNDGLAGRKLSLDDVARSVGIDFQYDVGNDQTDGSYFLHQTMGGGIGVLDYDRDGWPDLYFSQAGVDAFATGGPPNRLYRNLSGKRFAEVTGQTDTGDTGYGQGVTAADINQDGFVDLIVSNIGLNVIYRNNGDGTFSRATSPALDEQDRWTSSIAVADLDGDGLAELVECNYVDDPRSTQVRCTRTDQFCAPAGFTPAGNRWFRGTEEGTFISWNGNGKEGINEAANYSLGVVVANIDGNAGNDVFISNDTRENTFWVSTPNPPTEPATANGSRVYRLAESARLRGCATGSLGELMGCMGIATGDFDRDGSLDLHVTNFYNEASNLYLQRDAGLFVDAAGLFEMREPSRFVVGFGTQSADLDRDGWLDLVVVNGHAVDRRSKGEPLQMPPQLFRGTVGRFAVEVPEHSFWTTATLGRTLATLDWNRDGKPDMVANHLDAPVSLLQNNSTIGHWIRFDLIGTQSERDAIGSKVTIECGDESWVSWVTAGDGYFCTNEPTIDFGIGDAKRVDRVTVTWPSGRVQQWSDLEIDQSFVVIEGQQEAFRR